MNQDYRFGERKDFYWVVGILSVLTIIIWAEWALVYLSVNDISKCENKQSSTCPFFTCPVEWGDEDGNTGYLPVVETEKGPMRLDPDLED
jgi:hypothetical protein